MRLLYRGVALYASALLVLGGCSSSPSQNPPGTGIDAYTIGVTVVNDSTNCAWITPYWANKLSPWHIFTGDTVRPRFVDAGSSYKFAYLVIPKNPIAPSVELRVRAEVQRGPGCNNGTLVDVENNNKYLTPREGILDGCAHLKNNGGNFFVTEPTQTTECK